MAKRCLGIESEADKAVLERAARFVSKAKANGEGEEAMELGGRMEEIENGGQKFTSSIQPENVH